MILQQLTIRHFRNLEHVELTLHPRCNVFVGGNGEGKTSLLESMYFLSRGQSFRTHMTSPLIQFHHSALSLTAKNIEGDQFYFEKPLKGSNKLYLNQKKCQRMSDMTKLLPCQLFYQDHFQIIDASSQIRRQLLDWGLFYIYPEYLKLWQDFKRVLLQRNAVLKQKGSRETLRLWNKPFVDAALKINDYRERYVKDLQQELSAMHGPECQLKYFNGWDKTNQGLSLFDMLGLQEEFDCKHLYTHSGPHHADVLFLATQGKGKLEWSRGQQKMILILLKLAQSKLLNRVCLYLIDDIAAELDQTHLHHLYSKLQEVNGQLMMTALDDAAKTHPFFADSRWFYIQNGGIHQIIDV
jgi:DNA replication and repair protein RecF